MGGRLVAADAALVADIAAPRQAMPRSGGTRVSLS